MKEKKNRLKLFIKDFSFFIKQCYNKCRKNTEGENPKVLKTKNPEE